MGGGNKDSISYLSNGGIKIIIRDLNPTIQKVVINLMD
jgi:hypothetical protein